MPQVVKESITYWTHDGSLPVELRKSRNVSMDPDPVSSYLDAYGEHNKGRLTRSSPIGPAEHDEGGSLVPKAGQTKVRDSVALSGTSTAPCGQDFDPAIAFSISTEKTHRPRSVSSLLMRFKAI